MSFMVAFGLASIMMCLGVFLRAKVPFLRNMLVPACVIAGILGFAFMNVAAAMKIDLGTDSAMFTEVVNHLFTISFISISLTSAPKDGGAKNAIRGALGLGIVWCLLYALTPIVSVGIIWLIGGKFQMAPIYGSLIQFAFCQGPGQSASFGMLFEQYGWENATMVAMLFASVGFLVAFFVGIPVAKLGIKKGVAKHCGSLDEITMRGYLLPNEQKNEYMIKDTTVNSNIETLGFHFAVIGVCYMLAILIAKLFSYLPSFLGSSMSGMMFMNGMYAAYIVKFLMKKLKIDYLLENTLQSKITGWTSDYLVVFAFMAVSIQVVGKWLLPILVVCLVITALTFVVCFFFGQRFGGSNDFERTLGLYGTCTGTVPSGISLVRIVDPNFHTSTAVELGACNLVMMLSTPVYFIILAVAAGVLKLSISMILLAACVLVYLVLLKVLKLWGKKTYSLR